MTTMMYHRQRGAPTLCMDHLVAGPSFCPDGGGAINLGGSTDLGRFTAKRPNTPPRQSRPAPMTSRRRKTGVPTTVASPTKATVAAVSTTKMKVSVQTELPRPRRSSGICPPELIDTSEATCAAATKGQLHCLRNASYHHEETYASGALNSVEDSAAITTATKTRKSGAICNQQQTPDAPPPLSVPLFNDDLSGALLCNIRSLFHRGRLPMGTARLPLSLTSQLAHYVNFKLHPPTMHWTDPGWAKVGRIPVSMLCYETYESPLPLFEIPLAGADLVARTCSESGPCLYLSTMKGVFEFQCQATGRYNYDFWESQLKFLGVRLILPNDLFTPTSTKPIGEGSFAKVYTAIHRPTGQPVVIKRVPKDKLSSLPESHLSAVHIEIDVLRRIYHPFIVQFNTAFEDECYYYIVLERLPGGTVNDWLRQHRNMSESQARGAMLRVLSALAALESNNVIHRDLKLENLVLQDPTDPTSLKVIDFGLAAYLGTPRMSMHCGSPGFVAPEIINKQPYGKRVDMFSAGVLLYAFLSGKTPFHADGDTASETLYKNKMCNVTFDSSTWSHVSYEAKQLIAQLLTKDPEHRLSATEALAHPWFLRETNPLSTDTVRFQQMQQQVSNQDLGAASAPQEHHPQLPQHHRPQQNPPQASVTLSHPLRCSQPMYQQQNPYLRLGSLSHSSIASFQATVSRLPLVDNVTHPMPPRLIKDKSQREDAATESGLLRKTDYQLDCARTKNSWDVGPLPPHWQRLSPDDQMSLGWTAASHSAGGSSTAVSIKTCKGTACIGMRTTKGYECDSGFSPSHCRATSFFTNTEQISHVSKLSPPCNSHHSVHAASVFGAPCRQMTNTHQVSTRHPFGLDRPLTEHAAMF